MKNKSGFVLIGLLIVLVPAVWAKDIATGTWSNRRRYNEHSNSGSEQILQQGINSEVREKIAGRVRQIVDDLSTEQPDIKIYLDKLKQISNPKKRIFLKRLFKQLPSKGVLRDPDVKPVVAKYLKLELESLVIADQIHNGDGDINMAKERLKTVLSKSFDQKQLVRSLRLKRLEQVLNQSKSELTYRNSHKQSIIEQRYKTLIDDQEKIRW